MEIIIYTTYIHLYIAENEITKAKAKAKASENKK